jgi:hypothetical protein
MSTAEWDAFGQRLIRMWGTITWTVGWCVARHITKSDNWPHILRWHYQVGTLLWSDSLLLHWTSKWERNCPRLLSAGGVGGCYCTHAQFVFPWRYYTNNFKPNLATTLTRSNSSWGKWKAQFAKIVLTLSLNERHEPQIYSGTSVRLNCRVSLQTR